MADDENKIVVEVPNNSGNYSQLLPQPSPSELLTEFRRGVENAIAFPDNFGDMVYECLSMVTIPALLMSIWLQPLPAFLRLAALLLLIIAATSVWHLFAIPEIRGLLTFRVFLVGLGVTLALLP